MKDKYGLLAYPIASVRVMKNMKVLNHSITIDGETFEVEGFICLIINTGVPGGIKFPDHPDIDPGDGLLDLIMLNKTIRVFALLCELPVGYRESQGASPTLAR